MALSDPAIRENYVNALVRRHFILIYDIKICKMWVMYLKFHVY